VKFLNENLGPDFSFLKVEEWSGVFHGFGDKSLNIPVEDGRINTTPWKELQTGYDLLVLMQDHGKKIVSLTNQITPEEINSFLENPPTADAWIASRKILGESKLVVAIRSADCFPILVKSKNTDLVAAVHCGWRGAQTGLLLDVITQLARLGAQQRELEVVIGPGAQSGAYEIKADVASKLEMSYEFVNFPTATEIPEPTVKRDGKIFAALTNLLSAQAVFAGVPKASILLSPDCTISDEKYFSFRRQNEEAGRQISFIGPAISE